MSKLTLAFKGHVLKSFPVTEGNMLIGSKPDCGIYVNSLALLPVHARIETSAGQSTLFNMASREGTFVNHQRCEQHLLRDGDLIRVGKHTLTYSAHDMARVEAPPADPYPSMVELQQPLVDMPPAQAADKTIGWLQILNGHNIGKTLSLHRVNTNFGKAGLATAVITRRDEGYFISHLEGKYPPLVDDTPIREHSYKLSDGEVIQIGNIRLKFYLE
ncbi:MAG: FHA domain-containing protein [Gammaproteobacteria bacterium]|nr:FHA domain-containing protein [Gammaproteobacteria bacterium]